MNSVFLGLGSNKGDRLNFLRQAVFKIASDTNFELVKCASIYETEPYGVKDQPNYFNSVIYVKTNYSLKELYSKVKSIELEIGRVKTFRWGPREIDIDILLYNSLVFSDEKITVPHKDLLNRDFVLKPLLEIVGEFNYPNSELKVNDDYLTKLEKYIIAVYKIDLLNYNGAKVVWY